MAGARRDLVAQTPSPARAFVLTSAIRALRLMGLGAAAPGGGPPRYPMVCLRHPLAPQRGEKEGLAEATLTITEARSDRTQTVELDPKGMILGRSPRCDVFLDSDQVSRRHASIFQDPFERWILEDLDSRNGTWVGAERVRAVAVVAGQQVRIGPFTLRLLQEIDEQIAPGETGASTTSVVVEDDGAATDVVQGDRTATQPLMGARIAEFNQVEERLARLTSPAELYPEVCRCLTGQIRTLAAVVRLAGGPKQPAGPLEVLACYLGAEDGPVAGSGAKLHISRRILEAVRAGGSPAMRGGSPDRAGGGDLTIVDARHPRAVFAAPLTEGGKSLDVLYLDAPGEQVRPGMLDFVQAVARQIALARKSLLLAEFRAERRVLDEQLAFAREIQGKLTPDVSVFAEAVDVALHYEPAMWVGGDYCDMWRLADGRLAFAVGDVAGKGLPAALVMSNLQAAMQPTMSFCAEPGRAITQINQHLVGKTPEGMFVTLFFGLFDTDTGQLEYVNAGHIPPLIVSAGGGQLVAEPLTGTGHFPVGVLEAEFTACTRPVEPGTGLVIVTDGITEAMGRDDSQLGLDGLRDALLASDARTAEEMMQVATKAADDFRGHYPQHDDVTVFALIRRT